jgi:hypothetical protein
LAMIRQGDTQVSASLPSGNLAPHPTSYYKRRARSVVRKLCPSLGELDAVTKQITLNTPLAGTHNEGVPVKQAVGVSLLARAGAKRASASWESWFNNLDGIASRKNRGTRQKGRHNLIRMMNEPANSGSVL